MVWNCLATQNEQINKLIAKSENSTTTTVQKNENNSVNRQSSNQTEFSDHSALHD